MKYGKDHKNLYDGDIPCYGSGGIIRHVEKAIYEQESVLIPRKGSLNNVIYVNKPFWSVDTMFFTIMKKQHVAKFVYHFVKSKNLAGMNSGSAVPSMTTDILNTLALKIPPAKEIEKFESIVSPMYSLIDYNAEENKRLSAIRDTLLPKLMSGEVDVSIIEI